jgi:molecular chaperone GrpE
MTDQQKTTAEELAEDQLPEEELTEETAEETPEEPCEEVCGEEKAEAEKPAEDEDLNTKYLRLAADFQNFRRRTEKEKNDIYAFANEKFAMGLLEVLDNFERAMEHAEDSSDPKFAEGMQLILKQLQGVLEKNKVEEIEALGKPFDPNFHNAVMTEAAEGAQSGTVTKVFQKGYMLNQKVIRPSMVAVAQ